MPYVRTTADRGCVENGILINIVNFIAKRTVKFELRLALHVYINMHTYIRVYNVRIHVYNSSNNNNKKKNRKKNNNTQNVGGSDGDETIICIIHAKRRYRVRSVYERYI